MENSFLNQANKELLDISSVYGNSLENTKFSLLHNFVFYFNCNLNKSEVDLYIENNFEALAKSFKSVQKTFIIVNSQNISDTEIKTLQYYFPALQVDINNFNASQSLLDYFGYSGNIQTGLIAHNSTHLHYNSEISIVEINNNFNSNELDSLFDDYFKHLQSNNGFIFEAVYYEKNLYYSPIIIEPDEIEFDDDDKAEIQLIIDKLNEIRNKGNFIALLPVLEKHLQDQKLNNTKLSRLYIDQNYKIWLVDYSLEVKLSHLTKAIYFLFLLRGHKINLSEFKHYKKELLKIYLSISNQENLGKMIQSVDLLISDKNAIYVHLSRIKSAFHKLVYKDIAENYCIQGSKYEPKGINLDKSLTNIKSYKEIWFPHMKVIDEDTRSIQEIADDNDTLSL